MGLLRWEGVLSLRGGPAPLRRGPIMQFFPDPVARRALLSPHAVAFLDADRQLSRWTWQAFDERVTQAARFLAGAGIEQGDRVALLAHNSMEWLELWFACGRLGAVLQALNWRLTPQELEGILKEAEPRIFCYGRELEATVRALEPVNPAHLSVCVRGEPLFPAHLAFSERLGCSTRPLPPCLVTADDPWVLCYTGGTTGLPKAAVLTHGAMHWNAINTVLSWQLSASDRTFLNAPLFHTGGMNVLTLPLVMVGGTSIVCRSFEPGQVFDMVEQHGITVFFGVPTMFLAMQQHPRWRRFERGALRWVISGGAPCPEPVFEAFEAKDIPFKTGYGLTEAGPNNFWLPDHALRSHRGAVGVPLLHVQACIMDPSGQELPSQEVGELWLKGPHLCKGYYLRPHETFKTFQDGWLKTGDLARRDENGFFWIVGRSKDVIISGGENIYPAEVENVLAAHPAVLEVAVVAQPDAHWGEVGCAVVVLRTAEPNTASALLEFARKRLAKYKVPRSMVITSALPRTGAGKVDKRWLTQALVEGRLVPSYAKA